MEEYVIIKLDNEFHIFQRDSHLDAFQAHPAFKPFHQMSDAEDMVKMLDSRIRQLARENY